ncbi:baeRF12 domain-containing protein, partial [Teichococcus vastitatis]|uniref:baeRF12 domain-containing protein n=1 Tax=Teichococcus vastitatis TaxID=2307076 RepID=UPI00138FF55D
PHTAHRHRRSQADPPSPLPPLTEASESAQCPNSEVFRSVQLAEVLYSMYQSGKYEALVLVADPQTLGQLRDTMHKNVTASLVLTLSKELTNHSVREITEALT